jgi:cytochrome P450
VSEAAQSGEDVFEAFNRNQGLGVVRDPYPHWRQMRRAAPIQATSFAELFGREMMEMLGTERPTLPGMSPDLWIALSFDAVVDVLRDGAAFSSAGYAKSIGLVMGHTILGMDEPEHGQHRALLKRAFSRSAVRRWEERIVRPVVRDHLAAIRGRGEADLVREVTFPFPVRVIAHMIGVPADRIDEFHRLAIQLISIAFDPAAGIRGSQGLHALFSELLEQRRAAPRDDLLSVLARSELDGVPLADDAIVSFLRLLAPAGAETTYRSSSNLLCALLTDPDQLDALRADPGLMDAAIEEGLRWEVPLTGIMRTSTRETQVQGVTVPEGVTVSVNLAAANHDETRWEAPERFDLHRVYRRHAAFAFGPHACLGMHLARMETRVLLSELFAQLPNLRFAPEAHDVHVTGLLFRSPLSLPVVWDA